MSRHIRELVELIERYDDFGPLDKKMQLLGVAIGTLRKDKEVAADINAILESDSAGTGAAALCRILIEDYLNLQFLLFKKQI